MKEKQLLTDPYEIAHFIKEAKKSTPVKLYIKGDLEGVEFPNCKVFGEGHFKIVFGEYSEIESILEKHQAKIEYYEMENDRRNSAIPILDLKQIKARIEPGAIIRDHVTIGENAVIMMGAVINIGAEIGENTMIDMNAVVGARGTIGKNVHIGAGSVIAGVLEPPSKTPVIIEDDVMIGANAVILEGVRVGKGAVVAAGAVVTEDVLPNTVVAGMPAKVIKQKDEQTKDKVKILEDLR
ncbi:MAG: 2,3,4,5-tetrahydropyridine-2,6-dicarboxylate N-acetyltransferase [Turicibacter sanguinis]|uniref:2,3,4,5-tetrahydropyridine-2,6-dicarboxylate N-acetyltransferase n=1 Tax=Turicibacter sanguinis TaxID=154288 RepID=UPI000586B469|nr:MULTISPECIES: 2,3,4,5-tetrahydropyridine-2,6-dicarboxylate N-acetyltransferase [Turicibacter]MCU7196968.1 2,3,4,5-tetrahydropyridine-2,6-dicarboxylate N-acetyltransferase [Turicibacter sanguinis]MCU7200965.1 2,3,4,5-tetrahydropyridine-2,6-dicarboxylate N-acetyltransferase [Turicibacter sanguinis]MCU7211377.1 2,3,4,5-tetrahydropyridine-2,6-dicarboxylate N-acetyltransferase [Turicibacter sanguinis]MDB8437870.1 2,3,4,5-tetrahydropyridine-2,6-dicarboxylate N-acetyltransferase [Turicibacter sangu